MLTITFGMYRLKLMIGFVLKKNFCDGWDNLLSLVVPNVFMVMIGLGLWVMMGTLGSLDNIIISLLAFIFAFGIMMIFVFAYSDNAVRIANFGMGPIKNYFANILPSIKDGFLFGAICGIVACLSSVGLPYYIHLFSEGSKIAILFAACVFWFTLISILSLQWFIPIRAIMKNDFKKCLKKCFIIFFDNPGVSLFMAIYHIFLAAISIFLLGCAPGFTGILLSLTNTFRILLYKYDWLEEHTEYSNRIRVKIPWDELIAEDKETLGPRSFRSFLFPWKD